MTLNSKSVATIGVVLGVALVAFFLLDRSFHFTGGHGRVVDELIARNVAARGGAEAWQAVSALRLSGQMDLGQGLHVPYTMEQKRPGKMCIEFEFNEQTATQCVAGDAGWKLLPFRGRTTPEPMTELEYQELATAADIDGLLFDSARRGYKIELLGQVTVNGQDTMKLAVELPDGAQRWVYLDAATALEVKVEATRVLRGEERLVETYYSNWTETDGLLIPHRQDTRTEGEAESHFLTVDEVTVNPSIDDGRFAMPALVGAATPGENRPLS